MDINKKNTIIKFAYFILLSYLAFFLEEPLMLFFSFFIFFSKFDCLDNNKYKFHYLFLIICYTFVIFNIPKDFQTPESYYLETNKVEKFKTIKFKDNQLKNRTIKGIQNVDFYYLKNIKDKKCKNIITFILEDEHIYESLNEIYKHNECINLYAIVIKNINKKIPFKQFYFKNVLNNIYYPNDTDDLNVIYFQNTKHLANKFIFTFIRNSYMRTNTLSKTNSYYIFNSKNTSLGEDEWD